MLRARSHVALMLARAPCLTLLATVLAVGAAARAGGRRRRSSRLRRRPCRAGGRRGRRGAARRRRPPQSPRSPEGRRRRPRHPSRPRTRPSSSSREPQGDDLAPAARRAGQADQGQPAALRPLPPLPPHREEARDEPAAHAAALPDGPPLARPPRRGRLGLPQPDGREEPAQPAHEGAGLRLPGRRGEGDRAARLPAAGRSTRSASATTRTRRSCTWTCARTGRRSGSTTRVRASARSTRRIRTRTCATGRADSYQPDARSMNPGRPTTRQCQRRAAGNAAPQKDEAQPSETPEQALK